jgi:hypothetical protein
MDDLLDVVVEAEERYRKNPERSREIRELLGKLVPKAGIEFAVGFFSGASLVLGSLEDGVQKNSVF